MLTGEVAAAATDTADGSESTFDELTGFADNTGFEDNTGIGTTPGSRTTPPSRTRRASTPTPSIGDETGFDTPSEPAPAVAFAEPESVASDFSDVGAFGAGETFEESVDDGLGTSDPLDG